jgi:hypothetical protein
VSAPKHLQAEVEAEMVISIPKHKLQDVLNSIKKGEFTVSAKDHLEITSL